LQTARQVSGPLAGSAGVPGARGPAQALAALHARYEAERRSTKPFLPRLWAPTGAGAGGGGYYTVPGAEALLRMTEDEVAAIPGFTVGRRGRGQVTWEAPVDARSLDLPAAIAVEDREVFVYDGPAWAAPGRKPARGAGLNAPAAVSLFGVWPTREEALAITGGDPGIHPADVAAAYGEALREHVEGSEDMAGAEFLQYAPAEAGGTLTFRVPGF